MSLKSIVSRKILILVLCLFAFSYGSFISGYNIAESGEGNLSLPGVSSESVVANSFSLNKLGRLVNSERTGAGISKLKIDEKLSKSALDKCKDMAERKYWSHNAPSGATPWSFIEDRGYYYESVGENLAYDFMTEAGIVRGWMNSEGHRENILDEKFKDVGYGICDAKGYEKEFTTVIVVQHLGKSL